MSEITHPEGGSHPLEGAVLGEDGDIYHIDEVTVQLYTIVRSHGNEVQYPAAHLLAQVSVLTGRGEHRRQEKLCRPGAPPGARAPAPLGRFRLDQPCRQEIPTDPLVPEKGK